MRQVIAALIGATANPLSRARERGRAAATTCPKIRTHTQWPGVRQVLRSQQDLTPCPPSRVGKGEAGCLDARCPGRERRKIASTPPSGSGVRSGGGRKTLTVTQ